MRSDLFRIVGWAVPSVCMAVSAGTLYYQQNSLKASERMRTLLQSEVESAGVALASLEAEKQRGPFSAVPSSPDEESLFLNDLRSRAQVNGVTIVSWRSLSATYGGAGSAVPIAPENGLADPELVAGLERVTCNMTLLGEYAGLRGFIDGLVRSDRLYAVNVVTWGSGTSSPNINVSFSRYIDPALPAAPPRRTSFGPGQQP